MYNLTCITNYNSIYSQLTVCTLSCTLPQRCQLNTLPLCNHDYIRDTDDHVKREQCTLYNYTEHYNELYWNRKVVLDFWIYVCNGWWWGGGVVVGGICSWFQAILRVRNYRSNVSFARVLFLCVSYVFYYFIMCFII